MVVLFFLLLILQASFHWLLKPMIEFSTVSLEIRFFYFLSLIIFAWLISGQEQGQEAND